MVRGRIFIKIFLGFWLVTITILGSWLLAARYLESLPLETPRGLPGSPTPRHVKQLIYDLENRSNEELPALLRDARRNQRIEIYLLKPDNTDLYGRKLPVRVSEVGQKLRGRSRRAALDTPRGLIYGHKINRPERERLKAIIVFKPPVNGLLHALGRNLWLRITLAIAISGLICFGLSRLMTNRVKQLKLASRRLAEGELGTRIDVRERGGDETDELARDFNSMAEQIEQQVRSQKRLLGDVSHELRSPLARLRIALALAQEDGQNSERHMQRIDREAERLEELIAQLLSSQSEATSLDVHIDLPVLLAELCADANFEGEAAGKQVEFTCDVEEAIVASHGDLLKKVFENILRNALQYTPPNSVVLASLNRSGSDFVIRIEDHGPGVANAELEKMFDEFYRVDVARPRETGGYGLGLAIAKRGISQHRGSIRAENTKNGLAVIVCLRAYTA